MTENSLLATNHHPNGDLFVLENLPRVAPKSDMPSMPDPYFALKAGDHNVRHYVNGATQITVEPSRKGLATITDKDIWLFSISYLVRALDRGESTVSRRLRFAASDFLYFCNRSMGGQNYQRLRAGLDRLAGTRILTNVATGGRRDPETGEHVGAVSDTDNFGLLDRGRTQPGDVVGRGREMMIEVTLPDWLYRSVESRDVLSIHEGYFYLRRPLDRRLYEIARKHCADKSEWGLSLEKLSIKIGASHEPRRLRFEIRKAINADVMPGYRIALDSSNTFVRFINRSRSRARQGNPKSKCSLIGGYREEFLRSQARPGETDLQAVADRLKRSRPDTRENERPRSTSTEETKTQRNTDSESAREALSAMRASLGKKVGT